MSKKAQRSQSRRSAAPTKKKPRRFTLGVYGAILATIGLCLQVYSWYREKPRVSFALKYDFVGLGDVEPYGRRLVADIVNSGRSPVVVTEIRGTVSIDTGATSVKWAVLPLRSTTPPFTVAASDAAQKTLMILYMESFLEQTRADSTAYHDKIHRLANGNVIRFPYPIGFPAVADILLETATGDSIRLHKTLRVGTTFIEGVGRNSTPDGNWTPLDTFSWIP